MFHSIFPLNFFFKNELNAIYITETFDGYSVNDLLFQTRRSII